MEFKKIGLLSKTYKEINKEFLLYGDREIINDEQSEDEPSISDLKDYLYDIYENVKFGIETAILLHKVGLLVKREGNEKLNFNQLTQDDIISNDYYIEVYNE